MTAEGVMSLAGEPSRGLRVSRQLSIQDAAWLPQSFI